MRAGVIPFIAYAAGFAFFSDILFAQTPSLNNDIVQLLQQNRVPSVSIAQTTSGEITLVRAHDQHDVTDIALPGTLYNISSIAKPITDLAEIPVAVKGSIDFNLETATIEDINRAMDRGALSSERLVRLSLARIKAYEPELHVIITLNPHALDEARALDLERRTKGPRSQLHGIPVLLKIISIPAISQQRSDSMG